MDYLAALHAVVTHSQAVAWVVVTLILVVLFIRTFRAATRVPLPADPREREREREIVRSRNRAALIGAAVFGLIGLIVFVGPWDAGPSPSALAIAAVLALVLFSIGVVAGMLFLMDYLRERGTRRGGASPGQDARSPAAPEHRHRGHARRGRRAPPG
jgi:hypothetical protein